MPEGFLHMEIQPEDGSDGKIQNQDGEDSCLGPINKFHWRIQKFDQANQKLNKSSEDKKQLTSLWRNGDVDTSSSNSCKWLNGSIRIGSPTKERRKKKFQLCTDYTFHIIVLKAESPSFCKSIFLSSLMQCLIISSKLSLLLASSLTCFWHHIWCQKPPLLGKDKRQNWNWHPKKQKRF